MLAEAVAMIAEEMEREAQDLKEVGDAGSAFCAMTLKGFARQLRVALKSGEGPGTVQMQPQSGPGPLIIPSHSADLGNLLLHPAGITDPRVAEALKQDQLARQRRRAQTQEGLEPVQRELIGGPGDDVYTLAPVDALMPTGAKVHVNGKVYVLREDGKLHFDADETTKLSAK